MRRHCLDWDDDQADRMSDKTKELRALTGLRGIAALSVALGHYGVGNLAYVLGILYWKSAAVDLFFCLSGFTLCVAYKAAAERQLPLRSYFGARIARIYPLFVISLAAMVLCGAVPKFVNDCGRGLAVRDFVQQVLMINDWPIFGTGMHWNFPAWSVSVEFFCYLFVFPALFYATYLLPRLAWWGRALLPVALMAVSAFLYIQYFDAQLLLFTHWPGTALPPFPYFVPVLRGVLGMLAGWLIYGSYVAKDAFWRFATRRADIFALSALAFLVCAWQEILPLQWILIVFPALVLGFSDEASLTARLVASRPVHYLGVISYSIYLLHLPWFVFLANLTGLIDRDASHHPVSFILLSVTLIPVCALSYRFVEMPLRHVVRRLFESRPSNRIVVLRWVMPLVLGGFLGFQAQWLGLIQPIPSPVVAVGQEVARAPTFKHVACVGWSDPEDWGVWSLGWRSLLEIPLPEGPAADMKLAVQAVFFVSGGHPTVTVHLSANGVPLETVTGSVNHSEIDQVLDLPREVFAATPQRLRLAISVDNPTSPLALGMSEDNRTIGFGLKSLMLVDGKRLP
jgi:peptidoglycan/LPS O-acetylase OafA/YrhL